jgi:hypothetical protein
MNQGRSQSGQVSLEAGAMGKGIRSIFKFDTGL